MRVTRWGSELRRPWLLGSALLGAMTPAVAHAQQAAIVQEVIVTAQKREQTADTVPMSITTATGDQLEARGINSVHDLVRLVPGLTIQDSAFNSVSFTLRGVGFFNSDLATPAAVTIYLDEVPLPFPAMSRLAAFDLARVEVLKGPQGTLFGENATGGAVNYIAAKPTESFTAGVDAGYGNFDRVRLGGFVGGPINDEISFRAAVQAREGGPWQQSTTRPGDGLGRVSELQARASIDWRPGDGLDSRLTLTATHDGSESQAGQLVATHITVPSLSPGLSDLPLVRTPRAANWAPLIQGTNRAFPYASDTNLYQASWRNDLRLKNGVTLTSLTSVAEFRMNYGQDELGTPLHLGDVIDRGGKASSYFQEFRATGQVDRLTWLVGANAEHERTHDNPVDYTAGNSISHVLEAVDPLALADSTMFTSRVSATTYAVFSRLQYSLGERVMLEGGVRLNRDERSFDNCAIATTDAFVRFWNLFRGGVAPQTRIGDCYVLDDANGSRPVDNVHAELDQSSLSWRFGGSWTARPGLLVYANVSKGYKAGAVPVLGAATVSQFAPARQEALLAYEVGTKASLFDRRMQLDVAAFYYDYDGKQLRGAELNPAFGPLEALVSIPHSHVAGAEAHLVAKPVKELTLDLSGTYIDTRIDEFTGFDASAQFGDQKGTPFPFSPKWQVIANLDYEFALPAGLSGFVGGTYLYDSKTYAGVGALDLFRIDSYALLDLRAGANFSDGRYRLWLWGQNVTNTYYWNNVFSAGDGVSRFTGQPATYGLSLSARF